MELIAIHIAIFLAGMLVAKLIFRPKLICHECGTDKLSFPVAIPIAERFKAWHAHTIVKLAIRDHVLKSPPSSKRIGSEWKFYQPDYRRPYYGAWVHEKDYKKIVSKEIAQPQCIDRSAEVKENLLKKYEIHA